MNPAKRVTRSTSIPSLPVEIWHVIFGHFLVSSPFTELVALRSVSRDWKRMITSYFSGFLGLSLENRRLLTKRPTKLFKRTLQLFTRLKSLTIINCSVDSGFFKTLLDKSPNLTELRLINVHEITLNYTIPQYVVDKCQVETLYINNCYLTEYELFRLFDICRKTTKLTLMEVKTTIYGHCFESLRHSLKSLKLDLSVINSSKQRALECLMLSPAKLVTTLNLRLGDVRDDLDQEINLSILSSSLVNIRNLTLNFEDDQPFDLSSLGKLVNLESINLIEESIDYNDSTLTDQGLKAIFTSCTKLESIVLSVRNPSANRVTSETITTIVKHCKVIRNLCLNNANNICDTCLMPLEKSKSIKCLKLVDCQFITNRSIEYIWSHLSNLKRLNINNCQRINFEAVFSVINISSLEYLKLFPYDQRMTESFVKEISIEKMRSPINFENFTVPPNLRLSVCDGIDY